MSFMYSLISLSLVCNVVLLVWVYRLTRPGKAKQPELTKDASQLLADMLKGGAITVTQIIDPSSIFLYSPKDSQ